MVRVLILGFFLSMVSSEPASSWALVPYSADDAPLARFRETSRKVTVGGANITLEQDWATRGVAGVLWDSAVVLTEHLLGPDSGIELRNKKIVELGAGLGLPSIALSISPDSDRRPARIVATEQPLGLPQLRRNVALNQADVEIAELDWADPEAAAIGSDDFDLILGADLVYKEEAFELLRKTLLTLARPHTIILFASRIRYPKDRKFYRSLAGEFRVEKLRYDQETDVFLYRIQRL